MGILDGNCRYRDIKQLDRYSNEGDDVHTLVELKLFRVLEQFAVFAEDAGTLTGRIEEGCLLSERFAELSTLPNQCVGEFTFKGLSDAQKVYKPTRKES